MSFSLLAVDRFYLECTSKFRIIFLFNTTIHQKEKVHYYSFTVYLVKRQYVLRAKTDQVLQ